MDNLSTKYVFNHVKESKYEPGINNEIFDFLSFYLFDYFIHYKF